VHIENRWPLVVACAAVTACTPYRIYRDATYEDPWWAPLLIQAERVRDEGGRENRRKMEIPSLEPMSPAT